MANLEGFRVHTKVSTGICNVRLARNEHKARFHLNAIISATRWNLCHGVDGDVLSQLPPIFSQLSLLAQIRRRRSAFAALDALLHIGSPQGSANSVGEGEEDTGNGDKLEEDGGDTKTGICSLALLNEALLFLLLHLLELKVTSMRRRAKLASLENDK